MNYGKNTRSLPTISYEEFRQWVEVAAYYQWERRNGKFHGDPLADYFIGLKQVTEKLADRGVVIA